MGQCLKCGERLEDGFDICWNCGTSRDGSEDPSFRKADDFPAERGVGPSDADAHPPELERRRSMPRSLEEPWSREIKCRACEVPLSPLGQIALMKKRNGFFWGLVAALSVREAANLETFPIDIFRCPKVRPSGVV